MKQNTVKGRTHLHIYEANKNNTTIKSFRSLLVYNDKNWFAFLQVIFLSMFFSDSADEAVIRILNIFEDIQIMSIPKSIQLKRN